MRALIFYLMFATLFFTIVSQASVPGVGSDCVQNICVQDRIIDPANNVGSVVEVFSNGQAKVILDEYDGYFTRDMATLGKGYLCIDDICQNDAMMDSSGDTGKIRELFDNGMAKVTIDEVLGYSIMSFASIGIPLNCQLRVNCNFHN